MKFLLQATVISTIITGLFSFFSERRKSKIDCITKERAEWRKKLRKEIPKIVSLCSTNGGKCLTIQNLGKEEKAEVIEKLCFYKLSLNPRENENLRKLIDKLLNTEKVSQKNFLTESSFLLKNEWEKGKFEASGINERNLFTFFFLVFSTIVALYGNIKNYTSLNTPYIISINLAIITSIVFYPYIIEKTFNLKPTEEKSKTAEENNTKTINKWNIVAIIGFIIFSIFNITNIISIKYIIDIISISIIAIISTSICSLKNLNFILSYLIYFTLIINFIFLIHIGVKKFNSELPKQSPPQTFSISLFINV